MDGVTCSCVITCSFWGLCAQEVTRKLQFRIAKAVNTVAGLSSCLVRFVWILYFWAKNKRTMFFPLKAPSYEIKLNMTSFTTYISYTTDHKRWLQRTQNPGRPQRTQRMATTHTTLCTGMSRVLVIRSTV